MKQIILLFLLFIPLMVIGWVGFGVYDASQQTPEKPVQPIPEQGKDTWVSEDPNVLVIGNPDAKVTIYEYADFKCPECAKYHHDAGDKIRSTYVDTGLVKIVFRPYPVFAEDGARLLAGSYCAQEQNKFTSYYDIFFEYMWSNHFEKGDYQKALDPVLEGEVLDNLFAEIGLDKIQYESCVESGKYKQAYDSDLWVSGDDEIQGTPSFIINGQKIVGPQPFSVFKTLIDIALKS